MSAGLRKAAAIATVGLPLLAVGCATQPSASRVPVEERSTSAPAGTSEPRSAARRERPGAGPEPARQTRPPRHETSAAPEPAVVALLDKAQRQESAGELPSAAASLERALRIDPQNAWTWYRLGVVRFRQGRLTQAEQFARKSDALAGTDAEVRARSWRLIALIRDRQGDPAGAGAARNKANSLEP